MGVRESSGRWGRSDFHDRVYLRRAADAFKRAWVRPSVRPGGGCIDAGRSFSRAVEAWVDRQKEEEQPGVAFLVKAGERKR